MLYLTTYKCNVTVTVMHDENAVGLVETQLIVNAKGINLTLTVALMLT